MTINGINGVNTQMKQMGMNQATDSYSRNIQSQIANAQKQLQELSSNEDMSLEEKMKKRQEIQQQISDLNMQLRQHQMEQRKEKQQAKSSSMDDMLGGTKSGKTGSGSSGLSQASMTAMLSVDTSIKQAKVQGSVATNLEGRANVLKAEVKQGGGNVEAKKEEIAELEQKAQSATSSQISTLADANKTMEEAAKTASKDEKATNTKEKGSDEKVSGADTQKETGAGSESANEQSNVSASKGTAAPTTATTQQATAYASVDIRL